MISKEGSTGAGIPCWSHYCALQYLSQQLEPGWLRHSTRGRTAVMHAWISGVLVGSCNMLHSQSLAQSIRGVGMPQQ